MSDGGGDTGGDFGGGGGGNNNNNDNWNDNENDHHHHNNHYDNGYYGDDSSGGRRSVPYMCFIICGTMFAGLGLGLGGFIASLSMSRLNTYDSVTGEIIGTSSCGQSCSTTSSGNRSCSTTYAAIVEYDVDGSTYQFTTSSCR